MNELSGRTLIGPGVDSGIMSKSQHEYWKNMTRRPLPYGN
jgi:hypothetical protein